MLSRGYAIEDAVTDLARRCIRSWVTKESTDLHAVPPELRVQFVPKGDGTVHILARIGEAGTLPSTEKTAQWATSPGPESPSVSEDRITSITLIAQTKDGNVIEQNLHIDTESTDVNYLESLVKILYDRLSYDCRQRGLLDF
jgi:hypothetical protein